MKRKYDCTNIVFNDLLFALIHDYLKQDGRKWLILCASLCKETNCCFWNYKQLQHKLIWNIDLNLLHHLSFKPVRKIWLLSKIGVITSEHILMLQTCPQLKTLFIMTKYDLNMTLLSLTQMKTLHIYSLNTSIGSLQNLILPPNLKKCQLYDPDLQTLTVPSTLTSLKIMRCHSNLHIEGDLSNITEFNAHRDIVLPRLPSLKHVSLMRNQLLNGFPYLRTVYLRNCSSLDCSLLPSLDMLHLFLIREVQLWNHSQLHVKIVRFSSRTKFRTWETIENLKQNKFIQRIDVVDLQCEQHIKLPLPSYWSYKKEPYLTRDLPNCYKHTFSRLI